MKRFHARVAVVKALQDAGLFVEAKDNPMQIPVCSKSGDVIEPLLKPQWWVNCKPLAEEAIKVRDFCFISTEGDALMALVANSCRRVVDPAQVVGGGMVPMAGGHPRLVYLSAALVGPPVSGLFRAGRGAGPGCEPVSCPRAVYV